MTTDCVDCITRKCKVVRTATTLINDIKEVCGVHARMKAYDDCDKTAIVVVKEDHTDCQDCTDRKCKKINPAISLVVIDEDNTARYVCGVHLRMKKYDDCTKSDL